MKKLTESKFLAIWTEVAGKEKYDKKLFQDILQALKDNGFIYEKYKREEQNDYVTVSVYMTVDGIFRNGYKKTYERGREMHAYTLDDFASILFMWEHIFTPHVTYAFDGLLQEMEKKLPTKDGETAQTVFDKYWLNLEKTINDDFTRKNNGGGEIFPAEGDYLKFCIASQLNSFNRSVLLVKYAFLYWLHKYVMDGSMDEILADNVIPDYIRKIVDDMIIK